MPRRAQLPFQASASIITRLLTRLLTLLLLPALPGLAGSKPALAPGLAFRCRPGVRLVYNLEYVNTAGADYRVILKDAEAGSGKNTAQSRTDLIFRFHSEFNGQLEILPLEKIPEGYSVLFSLRKPDLKILSAGQTANTSRIAAALMANVYGTIAPSGRILSVRFPPGMDDIAQSLFRTLLAYTQFVTPQGAADAKGRWEAQEDDPNGGYVASYVLDPKAARGQPLRPGTVVCRKTKSHYLPPPRVRRGPNTQEAPTTFKPTGSMIARFDTITGRLLLVQGADTLVSNVGGHDIGRSQTRFAARLVRSEIVPPARVASLRKTGIALAKNSVARPIFQQSDPRKTERAMHEKELGAETLESLKQKLEAVEKTLSPSDTDTTLYLKFKALLYLHPETSRPVGEMLKMADTRGVRMRMLLGALADVGHSQAQEAILSVIRARQDDWQAVQMLVPALSDNDEPSEKTEAFLWETALGSDSKNDQIASLALFTLGIVARNSAETQPERANKIVATLLKRLKSAGTTDQKRKLLLALGNAGLPRAYSDVVRFTTDSEAELRAAAAAALRFQQDGGVESILIRLLTADPDPGVRIQAIQSLGFGPINRVRFEAVKQVVLTDKESDVRQAALELIWKARAAVPEALAVVRQVAENDARKELRKMASELLAAPQPRK